MKLESKTRLEQIHKEAVEKRRIQEERKNQLQAKLRLEAKNKIIIETKIQKYAEQRKILVRRCFVYWKSVLIERKKQRFKMAQKKYFIFQFKIKLSQW